MFHSQAENADAVNFKKGIAAAFQANLRGTLEETEIDPNSKHRSHYRLVTALVVMHFSVLSAVYAGVSIVFSLSLSFSLSHQLHAIMPSWVYQNASHYYQC